MTSLLRRVLKQQKINEIDSISKLLLLALSHADNLIPVKSIDVGFGAKIFLKYVKCSDLDKYKFREEFQKFLTIVEQLKVKSPLKSHLARGFTCFDPKIVLLQPDLILRHIDIVLEEMHSARRLTENTADMAKKQYAQLMTEAQSRLKSIFTEFTDNDSDKGLDEFYYSVIGDNKNFREL